jgi:hypothetical protein
VELAAASDDARVIMQQQWNDTDSKKANYSDKILSQRHCAHHEFHMD